MLKLSELERAFFELYATINQLTFPDTMDYHSKKYNPYTINSKEEFIEFIRRDPKGFKHDILEDMLKKIRHYQEEAEKLKTLKEIVK